MGPISADGCRAHLSEHAFKLQPPHYDKNFPHWPGRVGLEVEMLPVRVSDAGVQPVPLQGREHSTAALLRALGRGRAWDVVEEEIENELVGVTRVILEHGDTLSFEPGGQLEISSNPYPCLSDAAERVRELQALLDTGYEGRPQSAEIVQIGLNPWHSTDELGLQMPKARYRAMNAFFATIGPYGARMMRQSCTIQVCLDFGNNEEELAARYCASQLIAPYAAALFAYSPFRDGRLGDLDGHRIDVWTKLDPSRCGYPPTSKLRADGRCSKADCVAAYADFALDAAVPFVSRMDFEVPEKTLSFRRWIEEGYKGYFPHEDDWLEHLSLLFPEVRPKGFLELRSVDSQSRVWQNVPPAFYAGLLYDTDVLNEVLRQFGPRQEELGALTARAVHGLADPELAEGAQELMRLAARGFASLPPCFRGAGSERALAAFAKHFTLASQTPASALREAHLGQHSETEPLALQTLQGLEAQWLDIIEKSK